MSREIQRLERIASRAGIDRREKGMSVDIAQVKEFVAAELIGEERYFDGLPELPAPASKKLHEAGLANWWLSTEYGGSGVGLEASVDIVNELAYGDAGFAFTSFISILGTTMVQLYAGEHLKSRYLRGMAEGGTFCATLGSEETAGSELGRTATTFTRRGANVVLSGEKFFSTNTGHADFLLVLAKSAEKEGEFSVILVPRDTPGVEVVQRWDMIGMRGSATYQVRLTNCQVPAWHVLRGNGLRLLEIGLNASRILISATAIGLSRRIRDVSLEYAAKKIVKGAPLSQNAVFAAKLGQMEMQIDVMKSQCYRAAAEFDRMMASEDPGGTFFNAGSTRSALSAKMFCGQAGWQIATAGSEMFGGLGYTHDHLIGKLVRDLRYVSVVEGGEDVTRDLLYDRFVIPRAKRG